MKNKLKTLAHRLHCPACKGRMALRRGKRGPFWACKRYPVCKGTLPLQTTINVTENVTPQKRNGRRDWRPLLAEALSDGEALSHYTTFARGDDGAAGWAEKCEQLHQPQERKRRAAARALATPQVAQPEVTGESKASPAHHHL